MATLRVAPNGAPLLEFSDDVQEHLVAVSAAEAALRDHVAGKTALDITPDPPKGPAVAAEQQAKA
jgi:hypothetical protein